MEAEARGVEGAFRAGKGGKWGRTGSSEGERRDPKVSPSRGLE